jgi:amylosucrase
VFQANPATGDRRVSGMASSLAGVEFAERAGSPAALEWSVRRLLLAHAIVLGWGGIPVLWMGDELALPSDWAWADEPGHEADNRWLHRPRMDAARQAERHSPGTAAERVYSGLRALIEARASLPQLHAATNSEVLPIEDAGVLAVLRRHPEGELIELFNVTDHVRRWPVDRLLWHGLDHPYDVLSDQGVWADADGRVRLEPYRAMWIVNRRTVT